MQNPFLVHHSPHVCNKQDAQLSQRDRAAGCVIVSPKVEDWNWETIFYGHYRSTFNHCYIIGLKTRLNDLSYDIKIWTDLSSILSQITRLTDRRTDTLTDGRTDRILIAKPCRHSMQRGKNETYRFVLLSHAIHFTGLVSVSVSVS